MSEAGVGLGPRRNTSARGESINAVLGTGARGDDVHGRQSEDLTATPPRQPDLTANQNLTLPSPQYTASRWMVAPDADMSIAEQDDSYVNSLYSDTVRHQTSTAEERISHGPSPIPFQNSFHRTSAVEGFFYTPTLNSPFNAQAHFETLQGTSIPAPPPPSSRDTDSAMTAQAASMGRFDMRPEREVTTMSTAIHRAFSAEPDVEDDSDDDLSGGVTIRPYGNEDTDMQEANQSTRYSPPAAVGAHASLSIHAISPQARSTQTGTDVEMNDGNSDTDMDMHLDCDEPLDETVAGLTYDVSNQPRATSLGTLPLAELIQWIPPPQFGAARDLSGHSMVLGSLDEDIVVASATVPQPEPTQAGENSGVNGGTGNTLDFGESLISYSESLNQPESQLDEVTEDSFFNPAPGFIDHNDDFETNMKMTDFLEFWRVCYAEGRRFPPIGEEALLLGLTRGENKKYIDIEDLAGERCDIQGIDWTELGASREDARVVRNTCYHSYRNLSPDGENYGHTHNSILRQCHSHARTLPSCDNHFRFNRYMTRYKARLGQFQLRHLMAAPSRNSIFYAAAHGVICVNATLSTEEYAMNLTRKSPGCSDGHPQRISTLTAGDGVLAVGGYNGEYAIKSLYSANDNSHTCGALTRAINSITNHVHTFPNRRSGKPQAVFCSNDEKIRVLDCNTNTFVREHQIDWPVNCSATSPDGRLRLVVGDDTKPWIVDAETGRQVIVLHPHQDFGFACDWSPDGRYMATGNQDGQVMLWDARRWEKPLFEKTIATELGGIRSLHFSPLGEGRPVLLMAEPADIVSVVDAVTFDTRQRFDFYGEIGGTGFVPDGSAFYVANMDKTFGGIFEFERTGWSGTSPRDSGSMSGNDSEGFESDDDGEKSDDDFWTRMRPHEVRDDEWRERLFGL
ncbi:hypothetical protein MMC30_000096 [Trapelia coarctata]|nr:hypothetical protein [Trapelia coarctata]